MTSTLTAERFRGTVLAPADAAFGPEIAAFNLAVTHAPELVVCPVDTEDMAAAVRSARSNGLPVHVQGAGHGAYAAITGGVLISTRRMTAVRIDAATRIAHIGAGATWAPVVEAAAKHGLFPITGSAPAVGVVGYLLGGGLGPLARSHGFSSDLVEGATLVTGTGEVVDTDDHPELLWALRGGKSIGALVAEIRVRLVEQRSLYAGSLFFDTPHIEQAFRAWVDLTRTMPPDVSTSVGIIRFPPIEVVPPPLRGRRLMVLHFAYAGGTDQGARLAAPFRAIAPVYLDDLAELPCTQVGRIHNDPTQPCPVWISGMLLNGIDQEMARVFLDLSEQLPFGVEIRHLGEATRRDVPGGSAVGGRGASFTLSYVSVDTTLFATALPEASARLIEALRPWTHAGNNINFIGKPRSAERYASAWPEATRERLRAVRDCYDPHQVLGHHH